MPEPDTQPIQRHPEEGTRAHGWQSQGESLVPVPLPRGWTLVPVHWVRSIIAYTAAAVIIGVNLLTWVQTREVSTELLALAGGLVGLPTVLRIDERRRNSSGG